MSPTFCSLSDLLTGKKEMPWRYVYAAAPEPKLRWTLEGTSPTTVAVHATGTHVAVGDQKGFITLFERTPEGLSELLHWRAHKSTVKDVLWSGDQLVSCGWNGWVCLWNGAERGGMFQASDRSVNGLALSLETQRLLTVSDDGALSMWDFEDGSQQRWVGHTGFANAVAMHPSGRSALTGSSDATLLVWDLETGIPRPMLGHVSTIHCVCYSPDGEFAASGSEEGVFKVWEVSSGRVLKSVRAHEARIQSIHWEGDTLFTGAADYRIGVWQVDGRRVTLKGWLQGHRRGVTDVATLRSGAEIVSTGADRAVCLWHTEQAHPTAIHHAGSVRSIAFSEKGEWVVTGSRDGTVWVRDATNGERVLRLMGHEGGVQCVAFAPSPAKGVLSVGTDGTARVWDLGSGKEIAVIAAHDVPISTCGYSRDGRLLFTGARDGLVKVWDATTFALKRTLSGHENWVRSFAFHEDGRFLSGSYDGTIAVWNGTQDSPIVTLSRHTRPDGSAAPVTAVVVLPDGDTVVSGGLDGCLRFWRLATGELIHVVQAHEEGIVDVVVHEDRVVSAGMDQCVHWWTLPTESASPQLSVTLHCGVELDALCAYETSLAVGDRAGHLHVLGTFQKPLRLVSTPQ